MRRTRCLLQYSQIQSLVTDLKKNDNEKKRTDKNMMKILIMSAAPGNGAEPVFPPLTVLVSGVWGVVSVQFGPVLSARRLHYCNNPTVVLHGKHKRYKPPSSEQCWLSRKVILLRFYTSNAARRSVIVRS